MFLSTEAMSCEFWSHGKIDQKQNTRSTSTWRYCSDCRSAWFSLQGSGFFGKAKISQWRSLSISVIAMTQTYMLFYSSKQKNMIRILVWNQNAYSGSDASDIYIYSEMIHIYIYILIVNSPIYKSEPQISSDDLDLFNPFQNRINTYYHDAASLLCSFGVVGFAGQSPWAHGT